MQQTKTDGRTDGQTTSIRAAITEVRRDVLYLIYQFSQRQTDGQTDGQPPSGRPD